MKLSFPHPFAILLIFIALAALATHLLPAGKYERILDEDQREIVVQNSYTVIEQHPIDFFNAIVKVPEGIIYGADIVVLILIIGGAFVVVDKTGAFSEGIEALSYRFKNAPSTLLVLVGLVFLTLGALNNTFEEIIAMIPFLILVTDKIGYSRVAAVGISLGCAVMGAAFSPINPFAVLLAQKMANVTLFSGTLFRMVVLFIIGFAWITYIIKTGKTTKSINPETRESSPHFSTRSIVILILTAFTFATMVLGILKWGWDYNEMSAIFLVLGIVSGLVGKLGFNGTFAAYARGIQEMAFAAVIVGLARSVYLILEQGMIIDTIVHGLFDPLQDLPIMLSAIGMMVSHAALHVPIPSNSGQAVLTMPLLTPLADLIGMSRQVMILCYQYGTVPMDLITPTQGAMLAVLASAGVSFKDWFIYVWKPVLMVFGIGLVAVFIAILVGL